MTPLAVSVIIPAHNAAATLAQTLESLIAQTHPRWEAVIIENGSSDDTARVAADYVERDRRFRLHQIPDRGVSLARNTGLAFAQHEWVLFLDADDWIKPEHLRRMTAELAARPECDAVICGWARVNSAGALLWEDYSPAEEDLFRAMARTCSFAIHACVTRREPLQKLGGFDPTLRAGEDWDLWLRLARSGCRFAHVREALALYRVRPGSASMDAVQLLADSLIVLDRAYRPDPRVAHPRPEYADGAPPEQQRIARLQNLAWCAGTAIGQKADARPFLTGLEPADVDFEPALYANCLCGSIAAAAGWAVQAWADHYADVESSLASFLTSLESLAAKPGLARAIARQLERLILLRAERARPFTIGSTKAIRLELTEPIPPLTLASPVERLQAQLTYDGATLGSVELPVVDGGVMPEVLADAIVADHAWPILGRFFGRTLYPSFNVERTAGGWTVRRGRVRLGSGLPGDPEIDWAAAHDAIGWDVLLQEAWGLPASDGSQLYELNPIEQAQLDAPRPDANEPILLVEISDSPRDRWLLAREATAVLTVGGAAVADQAITRRQRHLSFRTLRVGLTLAAGFELCRACVREALIGQPIDSGGSLRARLAAAARRRASAPSFSLTASAASLVPGAGRWLAELSRGDPIAIWARRPDGGCGSSTSRRAQLPVALLSGLPPSAEPLLKTGRNGSVPARALYAPEIFWRPTGGPRRRSEIPRRPPEATVETPVCDGQYFENLFASQADPWKYTTPYEQTKYEQTLALLPRARFRRALEAACAEGHFTTQLAPRVDALLATDVSPTALARARARCAAYPHVQFKQVDLTRDAIGGRFDLIVCSEVLYYMGSHAALAQVADKFAAALVPGGWLIAAHAHVLADEPDRAGFTWDVPFGGKVIGEILSHTAGLRLCDELRTPLYRIQLFERRSRWGRWRPKRPARVVTLDRQPAPLESDVEAYVRWNGGAFTPEVGGTARLPILMYHRIASEGPAALARYRVTPEAFEEQLAHLRANGYTSATLDEWQRAILSKRPLPGHRVLLTFDDGFRDFAEHAWPLLGRYGFQAAVFLPTDHVGGCARWDQTHGEPALLMDWSEIRELARRGVQFGSHTLSHPVLTSLPPATIARELLRSRLVLQERLGQPVNALAYPYGDYDDVVRHLAGASGYVWGLTCEHRPGGLRDSLLALPRLEVTGTTDLRTFRRLLGEEG